jgi:hypothetical protein
MRSWCFLLQGPTRRGGVWTHALALGNSYNARHRFTRPGDRGEWGQVSERASERALQRAQRKFSWLLLVSRWHLHQASPSGHRDGLARYSRDIFLSFSFTLSHGWRSLWSCDYVYCSDMDSCPLHRLIKKLRYSTSQTIENHLNNQR